MPAFGDSDMPLFGMEPLGELTGFPGGQDDQHPMDASSLDFIKPFSKGQQPGELYGEHSATHLEPYDESMSDSSSSKRAGSEASSKNGAADNGPPSSTDVKMEDGIARYPLDNYQLQDSTNLPPYVFNHNQFSSTAGRSTWAEDQFMNESFDFDGASGNAFKTQNTQKASNGRPPGKAKSHFKNPSQFSIRSSSRELSPVSPHAGSSASSPDPLSDDAWNTRHLMQTTAGPSDWAFIPGPNGLSHSFTSPQISRPIITPAVPLAQFTTFLPVAQNVPFLSFEREGLTQKTRVETQIRLKTIFRLPPGVTKLHLPRHTLSKPKLWAKELHYEPSPDTLELHTMLVCSSAMENQDWRAKAFRTALHGPNSGFGSPRPKKGEDSPLEGGEVWICNNCTDRERKRSERKKIKKPDEEALWKQEEWRRVVVFNTSEIKEFENIDPVTRLTALDLPMRIACYCRHQQEKVGFRVIFTIRNHQGTVLAQELTPSIMITDDHKTHAPPLQSSPTVQVPSLATRGLGNGNGNGNGMISPATKAPISTEVPAQATKPRNLAQSTSFGATQAVPHFAQAGARPPQRRMPPTLAKVTANPRTLSRPASPTNSSAPHAKKRKSSAGKIPASMVMTQLDTSTSPPAQPPGMKSAGSSPFPLSFGAHDQALAGGSPLGLGMLGATPTTPGMEDQGFFSATVTPAVGPLGGVQYPFPGGNSAHASRAPSPNSFSNSMNTAALQSQLVSQFLRNVPASGFGRMNPPENHMPARQPPPTITKLTPIQGSKTGGYEVTILGSGFHRNLEVVFGATKATATHFWAENILICIVPPAATPGDVLVTFLEHQEGVESMINPHTFRYVDDDEDKLLRTAFHVLARKMTGNLDEVKDFARSIINHRGLPPQPSHGNGSTSPGQGYNNAAGASGSHDVEMQLMKCLELIDLDDSRHKAQWDYQTSSGHTMLHMACSLGFHRFAAGLLARGASVDVRDNGGFTPMHIAALNDHPEIVRRLLLAGANPTPKSANLQTPADMARSEGIIEELHRVARRTRNRSRASAISAASSTTSLKSLWGRVDDLDLNRDEEDDEETSEYSSFDTSGSDEDDDGEDMLQLRRPTLKPADRTFSHRSIPGTPGTLLNHLIHEEGDTEVGEAPPSPNAATAAFRQFQQSMALYMQSFPQLPLPRPPLPQMPQMPALPNVGIHPDNQAYLYYAQFMRRLTALVPGIAGPRPGSPGSESDKAAPPPAYEDLYPQGEGDRKAKSAGEARAMQQQAQAKLAEVGQEEGGGEASTTETQELEMELELEQELHSAAQDDAEVGVLKIGRKNAITKEQQRDILRAHEAKFKRLSSDKNLFMIWIPLLVSVLFALLYGRFPGIFSLVGNFILSLLKGKAPPSPADVPLGVDRVVEVL